MNLKSSLQTSAIFTGVASMYIGPILAYAISDHPESVMVLDDPVQARRVQFHFEERHEEVIEKNSTEELNDNALESVPIVTKSETLGQATAVSLVPAQEPVRVRKNVKKKRNRYQKCQDNPGISRSGDRYHVDRGVVDYYARLSRYNELGHARWHDGDNGERDGFRLRRIHCDLHEAGMRNGDIVNSIDGRTVVTIREAIRLWFKIRRKNRVVLDITRKGRPLTLTYQLSR